MNWRAIANRIVRVSLLATVYVFAAPVYLAIAALKVQAFGKALGVIAAGQITCFNCGHDNVLNRLATCNRCRATEFGSLLYCSFCHQVSRCLPCEDCGITLRVLP